MFEITDAARKELEVYFTDKERGNIRIYLSQGGCSGPRLALALDEPADDDTLFSEGGFSFCMHKELLGQIGGVKIDLTYMGFMVSPEIPLQSAGSASACGGCSGSSSCSV